MARVVVAASCGLTGTHGQHGLAAVERLDLGLLVHTQDDGMLGRGPDGRSGRGRAMTILAFSRFANPLRSGTAMKRAFGRNAV